MGFAWRLGRIACSWTASVYSFPRLTDASDSLSLADDSFGGDIEEQFGTQHRIVDVDLAGGALLGRGIYSLTCVFQTLYHTLPKEKRAGNPLLHHLCARFWEV